MLANTQYFREAALGFNWETGRYIDAPIGSKDWYDWWDMQEERCLHGYQVGDIKITGRHYFLLNFTPMKVRQDGDLNKPKVLSFPKFWKSHYDWWWYKEIGWYGCSIPFLKSLGLTVEPKTIEGGRNLSVLKTRRAGFSYMEAADGVYNYNFIPKSKSFFFASAGGYLDDDGILNKVQDDISWLNKHTDDWWAKNQMEHATLYHQKSSYYDSAKKLQGFQSEILGKIVDKPGKARGADAIKISFEEGGSFPNLKKALTVASSSVRDGSLMTGQMSVFGTGGEENLDDIEGLQFLFEHPEVYHMLVFDNVWEEGYEGTECGLFVPAYMANMSFMDDDGNIDIAGSIHYENTQRKIKKQSTDAKDYDDYIGEHPLRPSEALTRLKDSIMPVAEAQEQKRRVMTSPDIQGLIQHGLLSPDPDSGKMKFKPDPSLKPLDYYPHERGTNLDGAITIFEHPKTVEGKVPDGMYGICVDPFYDEDADSQVSLCAVYVYRFSTSEHPMLGGKKIVACYVGRPKSMNKVYRNIYYLALYYNAKVQSEKAGGGKGLHTWFKTKKLLHLLEFEPEMLNDQEVTMASKNRRYFMNISGEDKKLGLSYFIDTLLDVQGEDENGVPILGIHRIYDVGLLDEIIQHTAKKNVDRISAQIIAEFQYKDRAIREENKRRANKKKRIKRNYFGDDPSKSYHNQGVQLMTLDGQFIE